MEWVRVINGRVERHKIDVTDEDRVFILRDKPVILSPGHKEHEWPIGPGLQYINPVIVSASPRDMAEVLDRRQEFPWDRFYAKYHHEPDAYQIITDFILQHKEYTHIVICPDDLIVNRSDIEALISDLNEKDYPVLAGICNINFREQHIYSPCWKVSMEKFFEDSDIEGKKIVQTEYEGFACTFIRRDVFEKGLALDGLDHSRWGFDLGFAGECYRRSIPIHVDCSVKMLHLKFRRGVGVMECSGKGIKPPTTIFEAASTTKNKEILVNL